MKIRSSLLVACMLVVPALAMFSHRIPAEMRKAVRDAVANGLARWQRQPEAATTPLAATSPAIGGEAHRPAESPPAVVAEAGAVESPSRPPVPPRGDLERRLKELGGMAFECRPMQGHDGTHVASCRVPLDASGQLMRVFQASGAGADDATQALVSDVAAWKQRMALRGSPGPAAAERRF